MRFFLDEGVPRSVGSVLTDNGHAVIYLSEALQTGSPDDLVALTAQENDAILVACDGDMKVMAKKYGVTNTRYRKLSLLKLTLKKQTQAKYRVEQALSLLEHEWKFCEHKQSRRLFIEIKDQKISSMR